jgi:hypothetical protein
MVGINPISCGPMQCRIFSIDLLWEEDRVPLVRLIGCDDPQSGEVAEIIVDPRKSDASNRLLPVGNPQPYPRPARRGWRGSNNIGYV